MVVPHILAAIQAAAAEFHVDYHLMLAIAKAESAFRPEAVSGKGAKGLYQFMDNTWNGDIIPRINPPLASTNPFDPVSSARGGAWYLRLLLNKYDQEQPLALAAYNWGMGHVDNHLEPIKNWCYTRKYYALSLSILTDLPKETLEYVQKIMRFQKEYKQGKTP